MDNAFREAFANGAMRDVDTAADLAALYHSPQGSHPKLDAAVARHASYLLADTGR